MPRAAHEDRPRLIRVSPWARHDVGLYVAAAGTSVVGALLVWSSTVRADGTAYLVRHLLTDPVLPDELLPRNWQGDALRDAYTDFAAELTARRDPTDQLEVAKT